MQPKTIITYLVDGNPTGIKTVELSGRIGKAIVIPRSKLKESKERWETQQPALYFLFGEDDEGNKKAYIGETENLITRLLNHDSNKDFWDTVIAFISKSNDITKADVKFLEANAISIASKTRRYLIVNNTEPIPNNLPEYQIANMKEFLGNIDILTSALGYPLLKELPTKKQLAQEKIYALTSRGSNAKAIYTEDGLLVLKGSILSPQEVIPYQKGLGYLEKRREKLEELMIIKDNVFLEDYLFDTPTGACNIISGGNLNGRIERKDENNKSLKENESKSTEI